jgi:hypothetical protein
MPKVQSWGTLHLLLYFYAGLIDNQSQIELYSTFHYLGRTQIAVFRIYSFL